MAAMAISQKSKPSPSADGGYALHLTAYWESRVKSRKSKAVSFDFRLWTLDFPWRVVVRPSEIKRREKRRLRNLNRTVATSNGVPDFTNQNYDYAVAHGKLDGVARTQMVSERHILRAYVYGGDDAQYHRERIEQFKPRSVAAASSPSPVGHKYHPQSS